MPEPRAPRHADIRRFCEIDGWEELTGASGRTGDHRRYRKILADGRILRTKISHGTGRIEDADLWRHIWHEQLGLEREEEFWDVLRRRRPAERASGRPQRPPGPSIAAWIVAALLREGVPEDEIRRMSPTEAQRRVDDLWSRPSDGT